MVEQPSLGNTRAPGDGVQSGGTFSNFDEKGLKGVEDGAAGYGFSCHGSNHAR
jgi:hypothetical protein